MQKFSLPWQNLSESTYINCMLQIWQVLDWFGKHKRKTEWKLWNQPNADMTKVIELLKTHVYMKEPPCVCMSTVLRAWRAQPGPEGIERSTQCKQRPPHDLRCLLAAKTRGLHILTIIIAFCSFSIKPTWWTLFLYFFRLSFFPLVIGEAALWVGSYPRVAVTRL